MTQYMKTLLHKNKPIIIYAVKVLLLAVLYHLAARLGLRMAYVQANTSPVWPPTGIGLAALLNSWRIFIKIGFCQDDSRLFLPAINYFVSA